MLVNKWGKNIVLLSEKEVKIPVDAFEIHAKIYGCYRIFLEYEIGTFALKIWTGKDFEYLDSLTNDKIFYGFDSMKPKNIQHNLNIQDKILKVSITTKADGNVARLEKSLGLSQSCLGNNPVRVDISEPIGLRMPSGNEPGANTQRVFWLCD